MKWETQSVAGRCDSSSCTTKDILPGEPVRLVLNGRQRWCWLCAWKRLQESVPRQDLPEQSRPMSTRIYVSDGKLVQENFGTFDRKATGSELRKSIIQRRELERLNALDPKLKQIGGDR